MESFIANIIENYSIEDLRQLKFLITEFENKKLQNHSNSLTIFGFKTEYENYIKMNFSDSYLKSIKLSLNHLMKFFGDEKILSDITIKDAESFKSFVIQNAPKGYRVYFRNLKAAFNRAVDWEYLTLNPFNKIKFKMQQETKPIFISKDELLQILKRTKSEEMKAIFSFSFYSGCRLGEVLHLKWNNLDPERQIIIIGDENFTTKNGKSRIIPIASDLKEILDRRKAKIYNRDAYVFPKLNGFPFNRDYVSRYFKKSRREAGLPEEVHFHSLRHSFASNLAIKGVPLIVIKELLGHSSIVTTQIYSHSDLDSLQKAIGKFDE